MIAKQFRRYAVDANLGCLVGVDQPGIARGESELWLVIEGNASRPSDLHYPCESVRFIDPGYKRWFGMGSCSFTNLDGYRRQL
jgi:hypothetical protein